jgi:hypothetical protein
MVWVASSTMSRPNWKRKVCNQPGVGAEEKQKMEEYARSLGFEPVMEHKLPYTLRPSTCLPEVARQRKLRKDRLPARQRLTLPSDKCSGNSAKNWGFLCSNCLHVRLAKDRRFPSCCGIAVGRGNRFPGWKRVYIISLSQASSPRRTR